jgi:mannose-6-phosphate isomerase-like protein (cupin superfamily)
MRRPRARTLTLALVALLCTAPGLETPAPPMLDVLLGDQRVRMPLARLAERVPLADDEDFRVAEIGRDATTSHHVVAIRSAEVPHRHDRHELFVVMLRGHGSWRVGGVTQPVGEGSLLHVPRGTVHAFTNAGAEPALAYAIYAPPFAGDDRVDVAR